MVKSPTSLSAAAMDPKKVFDQAERFRVADRLLRSDRFEMQVTEVIILPAIVLSAFSSELFMKCIVLLEGGKLERTHNLYSLFGKLTKSTQDRIVALWDAEIATDKDQLDQLQAVAGVPVPRDLPGVLKECGDAFTAIRYEYEDPLKANFLMSELPPMLKEVVLAARPDWK
jgi:HEPN domain-containing protein